MPRLGAHAATVVGVAAVLAAVAFGAEGGLRLERLTWTEIGLVLTGTALVARGAAHRARRAGACTAG